MPRGRAIQIKLVNEALLPHGAIDYSKPHRVTPETEVLRQIAAFKAAKPPEEQLTYNRQHLQRVIRSIQDVTAEYLTLLGKPDGPWKPPHVAAHEKELRRLWRKRDDIAKSIKSLEAEVAHAEHSINA